MVWNYIFAAEGENNFDPQLIDFIKINDNEQVKSILQNAENLCVAVDSTGSSLLHYAAGFGNEIITLFLIKAGAKVNLQDTKGQTPLLLATKGEHEETISILLEHDADIYISDKKGISALQTVVQESLIAPSIIQIFLTQITTDCSDYKEIANKLLKVDCPLYIAVCLQKVDVIKYMLAEGNPMIDVKDPKTNQTALHVAVQNRNREIVKLLVNEGADVNALDVQKQTPLSLIKTSNGKEILEILVESGTDLTVCTDDGQMQMYWVLTLGTDKAVEIVLQSKIDVQAKDLYERSVMHYLANNTNEGVIEIVKDWIDGDQEENDSETVLSKSVDWDARDKNGKTPLHNAMDAANASFVKYLIKKRADVNLKTPKGVTPFFELLESSKESGLSERVKCVKLIMENGGYPDVEIERYLEIYNTKSAINRDFPLLEPIIAHLVLRQAKGERISKKLFVNIDCHPKLKDYLVSCKEELEQMKKEKIWQDLSLFDFLSKNSSSFETNGKIQLYIGVFKKLDGIIHGYKLNSYYSCILRQRGQELAKVIVDIFKFNLAITFIVWAGLSLFSYYMFEMRYEMDNDLFRFIVDLMIISVSVCCPIVSYGLFYFYCIVTCFLRARSALKRKPNTSGL